MPAVLDALGGGTLEAAAHYLQLSGESGGALLSRERDNVALFRKAAKESRRLAEKA
jgi:hypothetical protein